MVSSTKLEFVLRQDTLSGSMDHLKQAKAILLLLLARQAFVSFLNDNEMAIADSGYRGEFLSIKTPDKVHFLSGLEFYDAAVLRARHETVNSRFKNNQVLVKRFCHSLAFHSACFRAVAVISQLIIENGEPLFDVQYSDEGQKV